MEKLDSTSLADIFDKRLIVAEQSEKPVSERLLDRVRSIRDQLNEVLAAELGDDWFLDETYEPLFDRAKIVIGEVAKRDEPKPKNRSRNSGLKLNEDGGYLNNKVDRPY
ncbi:MAG: hypothetical protein K9M03_02405 [Kiritimatiellales bacterium]|nr:hypothetical protein [Kiritimatiellales bacterium]